VFGMHDPQLDDCIRKCRPEFDKFMDQFQ